MIGIMRKRVSDLFVCPRKFLRSNLLTSYYKTWRHIPINKTVSQVGFVSSRGYKSNHEMSRLMVTHTTSIHTDCPSREGTHEPWEQRPKSRAKNPSVASSSH